MALHTISLCTGLAGIERGLERAAPGAFKPILYCEREISTAAILAREIESGSLPAAPIWSDVKTLCGGSVARYLDRVGVDCITGGYPCQPFSVAGKRGGSDDPRHLWPWIARAVERYRPALCFFENVAGHLVLGFEDVAEQLQEMGYRVAAGIFSAAEVGATHRRERLFILGMGDAKGDDKQWDRLPRQNREGVENRRSGGNLDDSARHGNARSNGQAGSGRGVCETGDELEYAKSGNVGLGRQGGIRPRQTKSDSSGRNANDEISDSRGIPIYPPGPGDRDAWRRIIGRFPELAPALGNGDIIKQGSQRGAPEENGTHASGTCRGVEATQPDFRQLADGLSRADQLRAYGNAVVPDCAAVAYLSLFGSLTERAEDAGSE